MSVSFIDACCLRPRRCGTRYGTRRSEVPGLRRDFSGIVMTIQFGAHRFDVETRRLWSGSREVRLTPKASAVLKELVLHAGEPVSKEDLFATVWSGTAVGDDALTSCIQELRR